jgi:regulator of cell morphogenesis and NO signaling
MRLFRANTKMADVIHGNYLLLPVISRFGIPPGFGEEIVESVCRKNGIDIEFFLAIINAYSNEGYFPQKKLRSFNILTILDYLEKTHKYYTESQIPLIERLLKKLLNSPRLENKSMKLIRKFFQEYKKELLEHLEREDTKTFPYVRKIYRLAHSANSAGKELRSLPRYSMQTYESEHDNVDEKLDDLKNILIKYVHGNIPESTYNEIIFELFRLEKDIQDHTRIENNILVPLVIETENSVFPRTERYRQNYHIMHEHSEGSVNPLAGDNLQVHIKRIANKDLDGLSKREQEVL